MCVTFILTINFPNSAQITCQRCLLKSSTWLKYAIIHNLMQTKQAGTAQFAFYILFFVYFVLSVVKDMICDRKIGTKRNRNISHPRAAVTFLSYFCVSPP